jgi:hypothetical protein
MFLELDVGVSGRENATSDKTSYVLSAFASKEQGKKSASTGDDTKQRSNYGCIPPTLRMRCNEGHRAIRIDLVSERMLQTNAR